ncbi:MAG: plasmid replication protein, CyRepA1 family, partial [Sphaerospermopsis kisseleviana]
MESLESIGIFSIASKSKSVLARPVKIDIPSSENYINLLDCVTKENREILEGKHNETDDRSALFNKAVKDLLGWANWLNDHNLNFSQNPQDIIRQAGSYFGFHDKRINAILKSVQAENCQPAAKFAGGNEACIRKINRLLGYESKEDRQKEINDINWQNWLKNRVFQATESVEQSQFEFPTDTPRHNAIIAVRSGMGTGKTEAMLKIISESQRGSLIIGYRNNLLFQTISRGNEKAICISHVNQDGIVGDNEEISLSCCINSLYKLDGLFSNRTIFFDETISVLLHTLEGGTFRSGEQKRAMNLLEMAVKLADRVFLLDGNLNTEAVNFIHSFDPTKTLFTIENTKKIPAHNIIFVDGCELLEDGEFKLKPRKKSHLIQHLSEKDVVPFISTDSKSFAHNLQEHLINAGKCGIIISADTVQESYAKEFLDNPNLYITKHKPEFVIITPSCESGVSISERYFSAKYSFFCGVLGTSSQHQMMFRLRDNSIPHYVFCPESSMVRDNAIPLGYTGESIKNALLERINLSSLMAIEISSFDQAKDIIIRSLQEMEKDKWFDFSCKSWALGNFER